MNPALHKNHWHVMIETVIQDYYGNLAMWKSAYGALCRVIKVVLSRVQNQGEHDVYVRAIE